MSCVLIADDEDLFTHSLAEGLRACNPTLEVFTASDGRRAIEILANRPVDLLLTDLHMPGMDGFELLAHLTQYHPKLPVLVMTAFATEETARRLNALGVSEYVEKPVDFDAVAARIESHLAGRASGYVRGITLPTFLQILEVERKTCLLTVRLHDREGRLHFEDGVLLDAETGDMAGEEAALEILSWDHAVIEIGAVHGPRQRRVAVGLATLLLESARLRDERGRDEDEGSAGATGVRHHDGERLPTRAREEHDMSVQDKLKEVSVVDGFAGVGLFTPTGESLGALVSGAAFKAEIGVLANNVLINAQKSSLEMGTGRGQMVHVEAERAHILARCLNEGTDPLKSQPGKAHIHMVVVLDSDASIGMAKLKMISVLDKLAEDFRF